jgi:hypothetical protein
MAKHRAVPARPRLQESDEAFRTPLRMQLAVAVLDQRYGSGSWSVRETRLDGGPGFYIYGVGVRPFWPAARDAILAEADLVMEET